MTGSEVGRRSFLEGLLLGGCAACCLADAFLSETAAQDAAEGSGLIATEEAGLAARPARWWKKLEGLRVECGLCPKKCRVADLERGACAVRENRGGEYVTLVHSRPCSVHVDPIEKKPLHHVLPGAGAFSLAAPGCNMECKFCQNWEIAQVRPEQVRTFLLDPAEVSRLAKRNRAPVIACTYTEPVVWSEYVYDIAVEGKKQGLRTVIVSNGFIQPEPLGELLDVLAAVKIDLKALTEAFYRDTCRGELKPVLDTLRFLRKKGTWTEVVVLVVPTLNDREAELRSLARFVRGELGSDVPLHFTRFHPSYRLQNLPRTPIATLDRAREIAMAEGLRFVYVGNVPGHPGNHTYCPGCKGMLIERSGLALVRNRLSGGNCPDCGQVIPGIWS